MKRRVALAVARGRRSRRVRSGLVDQDRPRMCVHSTGRHVYVQLIDDRLGVTIASANSCEPAVAARIGSGSNIAAASAIGALLAERAVAAGVSKVVFDRGPKRYHGRIAALAAAARMGGLSF